MMHDPVKITLSYFPIYQSTAFVYTEIISAKKEMSGIMVSKNYFGEEYSIRKVKGFGAGKYEFIEI